MFSRAEDVSEASVTPLACPLVWAKESNSYCCVRCIIALPLAWRLADGKLIAVDCVHVHDGPGFVHDQLLHEGGPCCKPPSSSSAGVLITSVRIPSQIDLQIAKQGYRLAAWLNVIFDGATNLP